MDKYFEGSSITSRALQRQMRDERKPAAAAPKRRAKKVVKAATVAKMEVPKPQPRKTIPRYMQEIDQTAMERLLRGKRIKQNTLKDITPETRQEILLKQAVDALQKQAPKSNETAKLIKEYEKYISDSIIEKNEYKYDQNTEDGRKEYLRFLQKVEFKDANIDKDQLALLKGLYTDVEAKHTALTTANIKFPAWEAVRKYIMLPREYLQFSKEADKLLDEGPKLAKKAAKRSMKGLDVYGATIEGILRDNIEKVADFDVAKALADYGKTHFNITDLKAAINRDLTDIFKDNIILLWNRGDTKTSIEDFMNGLEMYSPDAFKPKSKTYKYIILFNQLEKESQKFKKVYNPFDGLSKQHTKLFAEGDQTIFAQIQGIATAVAQISQTAKGSITDANIKEVKKYTAVLISNITLFINSISTTIAQFHQDSVAQGKLTGTWKSFVWKYMRNYDDTDDNTKRIQKLQKAFDVLSAQPGAAPAGNPTGAPAGNPTGAPAGNPTGAPAAKPTAAPVVRLNVDAKVQDAVNTLLKSNPTASINDIMASIIDEIPAADAPLTIYLREQYRRFVDNLDSIKVKFEVRELLINTILRTYLLSEMIQLFNVGSKITEEDVETINTDFIATRGPGPAPTDKDFVDKLITKMLNMQGSGLIGGSFWGDWDRVFSIGSGLQDGVKHGLMVVHNNLIHTFGKRKGEALFKKVQKRVMSQL